MYNFNNITEIRVPRTPDLDSVLAVMLVLFVLGKDIKITIVDSDSGNDDGPHVMLIGHGGGLFDIRQKDSNHNIARVVARELGVSKHFAAILDKAARFFEQKKGTTSMSSLLKTLCVEIGEQATLDWALDGVSALLVWFASSAKLPDEAISTDRVEEAATEVWCDFMEKYKGKTQLGAGVKRAWEECKRTRNSSDIFDVGTIAGMMPSDKAKTWLLVGIRGFFARQVAFSEAMELVSKARLQSSSIPWVKRVVGTEARGSYVCSIVRSKNPEVNQAYRSKKAKESHVSSHILIQVSCYGTQIHTDFKSDIDLGDFIALLRLAECRKRGLNPNVSFLFGGGFLEEVPEWYFDQDKQRVFNGCISRPNVPRTALSPEEIVTVLQYSFQGERVCREFVHNRNILKVHTQSRQVLKACC